MVQYNFSKSVLLFSFLSFAFAQAKATQGKLVVDEKSHSIGCWYHDPKNPTEQKDFLLSVDHRNGELPRLSVTLVKAAVSTPQRYTTAYTRSLLSVRSNEALSQGGDPIIQRLSYDLVNQNRSFSLEAQASSLKQIDEKTGKEVNVKFQLSLNSDAQEFGVDERPNPPLSGGWRGRATVKVLYNPGPEQVALDYTDIPVLCL